jgi:hypothetical protein
VEPVSSSYGTAVDAHAEGSVAAIVHELEHLRRPWSSREDAVMQSAAHFWDVDRHAAKFPYVFESFYLECWLAAFHLRQKMPPRAILRWPARERS